MAAEKIAYLVEQVPNRPGVGRVRLVDRGERGSARAGWIREHLCTACWKPIGDEPFVELDGRPKHASHVTGA